LSDQSSTMCTPVQVSQLARALYTADFSVIDPYRMMHTGGSAEKLTRLIAHVWRARVNISATRCKSERRTWHGGDTGLPARATIEVRDEMISIPT
jgi:hypothetical protein